MARLIAAFLLAASLSACSGPFFYHDVIVPTYRQVDPNAPVTTRPVTPPP